MNCAADVFITVFHACELPPFAPLLPHKKKAMRDTTQGPYDSTKRGNISQRSLSLAFDVLEAFGPKHA